MVAPSDQAYRLYTRLFGTWKTPKRISTMTGRSDQDHKYYDIAEYSFSPALLVDHLNGRETYATTLGVLNEARASCKDYDSADEATGETWRGRATPDRVRAWITARWPDCDTTEVETVYPQVRKALQDERQQERQRAFWAAERARVRALDDTGLLVALGGWASKLARAEGGKRSGYAKKCAAHFAIHDDERRRRGLSKVEAPRDRASRKAATARTVKLAQTLNRPPERPDRATGAVQLGFGHIIADATLAAVRERAERPAEDTSGGACSSQPTVRQPPAPIEDSPGISTIATAAIARLKAQRDARQATGGDNHMALQDLL